MKNRTTSGRAGKVLSKKKARPKPRRKNSKKASIQKSPVTDRKVVPVIDTTDLDRALTENDVLRQTISNAIAEAELRERNRIAAELHDGVCQHLATIHLSIDTIQKMVKENDPDIDQFLIEIKELASETLTIARKVSHDLMPVDLLNSGFLKGIKTVVSRLNRVGKIRYTLNVWGKERKMEPNVSNNLYRIVQEFIHNSEKHSGATETNIHLKYQPKSVEVTISDNGKGFDPDKLKSEGIGLQNMFNRIKTFTNQYEFKAKEGRGVSLYINIPL
jgi:signal transduction histidine kinase